MPCGIVPAGADQRLRRTIHVVDMAIVIRGNDAFADRLQRVLCLPLAARQGNLEAFPVTHVARHRQNRRTPVKFDRGTLRLYPEACARAVYQLYLQPPGHVLPLQAARHGFAEQCAVCRLHEIDDIATDQLCGFQPDE